MRYFNVTEAIQYLNKLAPDVAPKNEETLRRAIRSGELPAEINRGRDGSKIAENDLVAFGRKYIAKQARKQGVANSVSPLEKVSKLMLPSSISEILKNAIYLGEKPEITKIKILENKRKWEELAAETKLKIQELENELNICQSEIKAMIEELAK
ncbi:MAG: hypothetical protein IKJ68_00115 [Clostridia bacterium]|nr:hypothetical protein [Clostridia bacterium]